MKWLMKGIIILLVISMMAMGLAACDDDEEEVTQTPTQTAEPTPQIKEIKIGVIGPMSYIQGEHHWFGAQLAAEEINAAGGISVGTDTYNIKLVQIDSNELTSVTDATSAAEKAVTVDKVDFLTGGIRSEAVLAMQEVAMDNEVIFLGCGASAPELNQGVVDNYERYKYWFRVTPVNSTYLGMVSFELLQHVILKVMTGIFAMPKVAILAEKAVWGDTIVAAAEANLPAAGVEIVGVWRPSPNATDVRTELSAIDAAGANIIFTALSGPVGIPYARQWGELEIPAASVGINVEAQADGFSEATSGYGDYELTLNIYARDVQITGETVPFLERFIAEMGEVPTYNAGTYDALYVLKEAIERADSLDPDAIVVELEKTDRISTSGRVAFDDTHDVIWGPGYVTAIGVQWQDGELKGVWPPSDGSWEEVVYEGMVDYQLPPWLAE